MNQCTTTRGGYRCMHEPGHVGNCEAPDASGATFGPYRDSLRARAYLRGRLDGAVGSELGALGVRLGMPRKTDEDDCTYRERIWRTR